MPRKISLHFDIDKPQSKILKTGDVSCLFEDGKIRYIRFKGTEAFRTIYTAVRDQNWNTAPYEISDEKIEVNNDGFEISYVATYSMHRIRYRSMISIKGSGNTISFNMEGEALSDFISNRIGICLLHAVNSVAGKDVQVTTPDASTYSKTFSHLISPHQPIKNITRLNWRLSGVEAEVKFSGDIFETEDQRNWSDSSFKTYSRPLDLPHPFNVQRGQRTNQSITIDLSDALVKDEPLLSRVPDRIKFPAIGYSKRPGIALREEEIEALLRLPFDHYRIELDMTAGNWEAELRQACQDADRLNTGLFIVCFFDDQFQLQINGLIAQLSELPRLVKYLLPVQKVSSRSMPENHTAIYDALKERVPHLKVGFGTNGHFADLNRNLPHGVRFDFVSFGLTPQAHSTDTISLLENLDNQHDDIHTLRHHLGDIEIFISPVTFRGRKATLFREEDQPADFDPRQHTEFGAAWLISCLRNFGGNTITLFDATGYKGIVSDDHIRYNKPSPFYELLSALKDFDAEYFVANNNELEITVENSHGEKMMIKLDDWFVNYRTI